MWKLMNVLMAPDGDGGAGGSGGDGGKKGAEGDGGAAKKDGGDGGDGGKKGSEGSGAEGDGKKGAEGDGKKGGGDGGGDGKGGEKPSESGKPKAGDKSAEKPESPDKYDLRSPEGSTLDEADLKRVAKLAHEQGWTNAEAQSRIDFAAASIKAQSEQFLAETEADPEIGGEKLEETLTLSRKALDGLYPKGTKHGDEFRQLLDRTGYTNHRVIIRHFAELARRMGEDLPTGGGRGASGGERDAVSILYDNTKAE